MKKMLKGLFAVLTFTAIFAAAEVKAAGESGFKAGAEYWSTYLWRGQYLFGDQQGWIFPYASFEIIDGLSIGVEGEMNAGWAGTKKEEPEYSSDQRGHNAFDFGVDYKYTAEGRLTISAGLWYLMTRKTFYSFITSYIGLDFEMFPFVTPLVKVTADYYTGNKIDGDEYKDINGNSNRMDLYFQAGLKKSIEIVEETAGVDFGAVVGYARYRALGTTDKKKINDISDIDLFVNSSLTYGLVTFNGGFHYVIVPGKQFKYNSPDNYISARSGNREKDIHRFFAIFGASISI